MSDFCWITYILAYCSVLIDYRKSFGIWAQFSFWKSTSFLIISLGTCVAFDFMNSNKIHWNLVRSSQRYTSIQMCIVCWFYVNLHGHRPTGWKRAEGSFQHFFVPGSRLIKICEIKLPITMRTLIFMDPTSSKKIILFLLWVSSTILLIFEAIRSIWGRQVKFLSTSTLKNFTYSLHLTTLMSNIHKLIQSVKRSVGTVHIINVLWKV